MSEHTHPATPCARCEVLPLPLQGAGQFYMWLPLGHTLGKVAGFLAEGAIRHAVMAGDRCVVLTLEDEAFGPLFAALSQLLSPEELKDTKTLFMRDGGAPGLADFARVQSLKETLSLRQASWLLEMLEQGRFTSHFQPIVHAQDTSRIFGQEALLRGRDRHGKVLPPTLIFQAAREAGLMFHLDLAARKSAIREATAHGVQSSVFINFNPTAIYDPTFCLRSTLRTIDELGLRRDQVVFEVVESDHLAETGHLRNILDFYRAEGFRIALDDLGSGYSSLNLIHEIKPDFLKLDMALIRDVDTDPYKATVTRSLLELAAQLEIPTIAEGIETAGELEWVRQHGATYVQGYLIAKPASPPVFETPAFVRVPGAPREAAGAVQNERDSHAV